MTLPGIKEPDIKTISKRIAFYNRCAEQLTDIHSSFMVNLPNTLPRYPGTYIGSIYDDELGSDLYLRCAELALISGQISVGMKLLTEIKQLFFSSDSYTEDITFALVEYVFGNPTPEYSLQNSLSLSQFCKIAIICALLDKGDHHGFGVIYDERTGLLRLTLLSKEPNFSVSKGREGGHIFHCEAAMQDLVEARHLLPTLISALNILSTKGITELRHQVFGLLPSTHHSFFALEGQQETLLSGFLREFRLRIEFLQSDSYRWEKKRSRSSLIDWALVLIFLEESLHGPRWESELIQEKERPFFYFFQNLAKSILG